MTTPSKQEQFITPEENLLDPTFMFIKENNRNEELKRCFPNDEDSKYISRAEARFMLNNIVPNDIPRFIDACKNNRQIVVQIADNSWQTSLSYSWKNLWGHMTPRYNEYTKKQTDPQYKCVFVTPNGYKDLPNPYNDFLAHEIPFIYKRAFKYKLAQCVKSIAKQHKIKYQDVVGVIYSTVSFKVPTKNTKLNKTVGPQGANIQIIAIVAKTPNCRKHYKSKHKSLIEQPQVQYEMEIDVNTKINDVEVFTIINADALSTWKQNENLSYRWFNSLISIYTTPFEYFNGVCVGKGIKNCLASTIKSAFVPAFMSGMNLCDINPRITECLPCPTEWDSVDKTLKNNTLNLMKGYVYTDIKIILPMPRYHHHIIMPTIAPIEISDILGVSLKPNSAKGSVLKDFINAVKEVYGDNFTLIDNMYSLKPVLDNKCFLDPNDWTLPLLQEASTSGSHQPSTNPPEDKSNEEPNENENKA